MSDRGRDEREQTPKTRVVGVRCRNEEEKEEEEKEDSNVDGVRKVESHHEKMQSHAWKELCRIPYPVAS